MIEVTSGSISLIHSLAVAKGAHGVISYDSPCPLQVPLMIPISGIRGYSDAITKLDPKITEKYPYNKGRVDTQEISRLCNGKNSALDIKKLIDTQSLHEVTDLQDVINYIYILKEAGLVII
jgi:hypothetical protein